MSAPSIPISHPERVIYPRDGISKQQVADYYAAVMDWFLPGVRNRPTSVLRCPEGIEQPGFFQKHPMQGLGHVGTLDIDEATGKQAEYLVPRDAASVLELVQFGSLEFHPWGATAADPEHADRLIFDFDPGPEVAWPKLIAAARLARGLLERLGLRSYVRSTGGRGLHVALPLRPASDWASAQRFGHGFAQRMAALHPQDFVTVAAKQQRSGRIFIDYLRNSRGATSVASYSLRAQPGAPVATPLRWEGLGKSRSGQDFGLRTLPRRLARLRSDPWEGFDEISQSLHDRLDRELSA